MSEAAGKPTLGVSDWGPRLLGWPQGILGPLASQTGRLRQARLWRPGSPMACSYISFKILLKYFLLKEAFPAC